MLFLLFYFYILVVCCSVNLFIDHINFFRCCLGKSVGLARSASRSSHLRPTSPKSPVASASVFESLEGSDEEDVLTDASKLDPTYLHSNGDAVSFCCILELNIYSYKTCVFCGNCST